MEGVTTVSFRCYYVPVNAILFVVVVASAASDVNVFGAGVDASAYAFAGEI